jgi:hypothetical protein
LKKQWNDLKDLIVSYGKKVHVTEQKINKELHAKDVKLQSLKLIHKTLGKLTNWEKTGTENHIKAFLYEQLLGQMEPNVK